MEISASIQEQPRVKPVAYLIFMLAACFYLYEFILQVAPSVMTTELMQDFKIEASGLGIITAFFFYSYTPMQIPAGMLFDRFGPRLLMTLAVAACVVGTLMFAMTDSVMVASMGRFVIGAASAFSFIGTLVLIARWFPPHMFALMAGLAQILSSVGAVLGKAPLAYMTQSFGWRGSMYIFAIVGVVLTIATWLFVRDGDPDIVPEKDPNAQSGSELENLKIVCKKPQSWANALYAFSIWAPIVVFAGLWCVPYLKQIYGIGTVQASMADSLIWIGIGVGSPLFGGLSDRFRNRTMVLALGGLIGLISSLIILYVPISFAMMCVVCFFFGVAAGGQTVSFAVVKDINLPKHVGTACGFNNMAVVAGGMVFLPLIGVLIEKLWDGTMVNGIPFYANEVFQQALMLMPICFLVAMLAGKLLIRETHAEPVYK